MWDAIAKLVGGLVVSGIESLTASAQRRAELRAQDEARWTEYSAFWSDFEARADDRARDAASDADAKPPRPTADEITRP